MSASGTTIIKGGWSGGTQSYRWSELQWSATQNIENNTTTIAANLYFKQTTDYFVYTDRKNCTFSITIDGATKTDSTVHVNVANKTSQLLLSYTRTISHAANGTKQFSISASSSSVGALGYLIGLSKSYTLPTIPRTSTIGTISGSTIGSQVTVNISAASSSFSHKYYVRFPNTSTAKISSTNVAAGTNSFNFTPAMSWCNDIPNSVSGKATVYLETYSGTTKIGSTVSKELILSVPASVRPTISTLGTKVEEGNSAVSTVTAKFVQSLSRLKLTLSGSGAYGSTISKREIKVNGQTLTTSSNTTTATTSALKNSGSQNVVFTVTDSRGRTASYTVAVSVSGYSTPKITKCTANRATSPETTVLLNVQGSWTSLGGDNEATFTLRRQPTGGSSSSVVIDPSSGTSGSLSAAFTVLGNDASKSFSYTFTKTDAFGYSASAIATVGTAFEEITIRPGVGVGIAKRHEQGALDVGGDIYADDIYLDGNSVATNISLLPVGHLRDVIITDNLLTYAENLNHREVRFFVTNTITYPVESGGAVSGAGFVSARWEQRFIFMMCSDGKIRTRFKSSSAASWTSWEVR